MKKAAFAAFFYFSGMKWYQRPLITRSRRANKKFKVLTPRGVIHFGDRRYKDYRQHRDPVRRAAYIARASRITDARGRLTINNPYSANYWAARVLWNYRPAKGK